MGEHRQNGYRAPTAENKWDHASKMIPSRKRNWHRDASTAKGGGGGMEKTRGSMARGYEKAATNERGGGQKGNLTHLRA